MKRKLAEGLHVGPFWKRAFSKEEIFALYSNQVYLGQQVGFSQSTVLARAASAYFNKDVTNLTLPESAFFWRD